MTSFSNPEAFQTAYQDWVQYISDTRTLVKLTKEGIKHLKSRVQLGAALDLGDDFIEDAEKTAKDAQKEVDAGFPALHAHNLIGAWGATERYIEDVFIAAIKGNPTLFRGEHFSKIKLPLSKVLDPSVDPSTTILFEVSRSLGADSKVGVSQFEDLLRVVDFGGPVPDRAKDSILLAQQIRHVWAHRGGVADARFVGFCPDRAPEGEKINVDSEEFDHLLNGVALYGVIVSNRVRMKLGTAILKPELPTGYEGALAEIGMA